MDCEEAIIKKLCMECSRRRNICGEEIPTYLDAYRCKWDEAQVVLRNMTNSFKEST